VKAAIVLYAGDPSLPDRAGPARSVLDQAGEINRLLDGISPDISDFELWLFYRGEPPATMPGITAGLSRILLLPVDFPHLPESFLASLQAIYHQKPVDLMVFGSDGLGRELSTRMAYRLDGASCTQVETCEFRSNRLQVSKPAYTHTLTADFELGPKPWCLSVAKTAHDPARAININPSMIESPGRGEAPVGRNPLDTSWSTDVVITQEVSKSGLAHADRVLAVGQGVNSRKNMETLEDIADALDACLGASRPVVMNAWARMDRLIGVSGLILSPKLCITAGVSGAGAFTAGIQNSGFIAAINTDESAPVFKLAHVGIVDDLFAVLKALQKLITQKRTAPAKPFKPDPAVHEQESREKPEK
jgi:electron transfer flavoprotein alpha subunit